MERSARITRYRVHLLVKVIYYIGIYLLNKRLHDSLLSFSHITSFACYLCPGAFGSVMKCVHKQSGEVRAVKIINKDLISLDELDRLRVEVDILKRLVQIDSPSPFFYNSTKSIDSVKYFILSDFNSLLTRNVA